MIKESILDNKVKVFKFMDNSNTKILMIKRNLINNKNLISKTIMVNRMETWLTTSNH